MTSGQSYLRFAALGSVALAVCALDMAYADSFTVFLLYIFLPFLGQYFHVAAGIKVVLPFYALLVLTPWALMFSGRPLDELRFVEIFNIQLFERLLLIVFLCVITRLQKPDTRSSAQLKALWNSIVDGLIVIDDKAIIQSVNPAAEKMFGYEEHELVGKNIKTLMPNQYADHHDQYVSDYNRTNHAKIIGSGREVSGKRKNGEVFPLYLAVNKFPVGRQVFYGGIVRDQTEEKKVEADLIAAKEAAEAASQAKSAFLNSMSHEVRTPLNAILGFAQLIEIDVDKKLQPEVYSNLKHISTSGEHLLGLLTDVLDLSTIETGNLKLDITAVSPKEIIESCVNMIAPLAAKYSVTVHVPDLPEKPLVAADKTRFAQALANLLTNAIKYNKVNGLVDVRLLKIKNDTIRVVVRDTGAGVPEVDQDKLFEPFNRLGREAKNIEGSGIGLSVTKSIMESMKGHVGFTSIVGRGSEFWLDLPVLKREELGKIAARQKAKSSRKGDSVPTGKKTVASEGLVKVLYVEDKGDNTILMENIMEHFGDVHLVTRSTGEEGVAYALVNKPDIILLDLNLPEMDGFEVYNYLKTDAVVCDVPVYAVSGDVRPGVIERVEKLGFNGFVPKPFRVERIRNIVDAHKPH